MKAHAATHKIVTTDRGASWDVIEKSSGQVVWHGKTFKGARSAHARLTLKIDARTARRLGN